MSYDDILQAGLLAPPLFQRPSHFILLKQWHGLLKKLSYSNEKGYSGGTAPDFNGIPS